MIRLFDIDIPPLSRNIVEELLENGDINRGKVVERFEQLLCRMFEFPNFTAVSSGTAALHLALTLAGVGPGDEVILSPQTFIATGLAIKYLGATPIFADIDPFGNIDVNSMILKFSSKTKAVIMVHWAGMPCDIYSINKQCHLRGIKTVEDAAHALGSKYQDGYIGAHYSDYVCFSFQAIKTLACGDGGGLVCNDTERHLQARKLRWFGIDKDTDLPDGSGERNYNLEYVGYKYNMTDIAAAIGIGQLPVIKERIKARQARAKLYSTSLRDIQEIVLLPELLDRQSAYWLYPVMIPHERDNLIAFLKRKEIETSVVHQGIDRNNIFGGRDKTLTMQRYFENAQLCLPNHDNITINDVGEVCNVIRDYYGKYK